MLYGDFHIISREVQDHLCDLLHNKGRIDKNICPDIIREFSSCEDHVSVEDFYKILQNKGVDIDKSDVEKSLKLFSEIGFASELQFEGENFKRYEQLHSENHHDHFVCVKCNKVMEFTSDQLESLQNSLIFQKGCRPLFHKLEVYGVCDQCQKTTNEIVPITLVSENQTVRLAKMQGGAALRKRLMDLGLVPNGDFKIIKNSHFGPIVLELKDARIAIGRGEAKQILVYKP
ncbi:MAG: transcriptional repressor [Candidatus Omnitrophica bacterium]|nr:transcriptional repressor [Candidatus Omnitrophota bacterium]